MSASDTYVPDLPIQGSSDMMVAVGLPLEYAHAAEATRLFAELLASENIALRERAELAGAIRFRPRAARRPRRFVGIRHQRRARLNEFDGHPRQLSLAQEQAVVDHLIERLVHFFCN